LSSGGGHAHFLEGPPEKENRERRGELRISSSEWVPKETATLWSVIKQPAGGNVLKQMSSGNQIGTSGVDTELEKKKSGCEPSGGLGSLGMDSDASLTGKVVEDTSGDVESKVGKKKMFSWKERELGDSDP